MARPYTFVVAVTPELLIALAATGTLFAACVQAWLAHRIRLANDSMAASSKALAAIAEKEERRKTAMFVVVDAVAARRSGEAVITFGIVNEGHMDGGILAVGLYLHHNGELTKHVDLDVRKLRVDAYSVEHGLSATVPATDLVVPSGGRRDFETSVMELMAHTLKPGEMVYLRADPVLGDSEAGEVRFV